MRIGILCEGEFSDQPTLEVLLRDWFPGVDFFIKGVDKAVIFRAADLELAGMFAKLSVERVLILWDLLPLGGQLGVKSQQSAKANRREQCGELLNLLCKSEYLPEHLLDQSHKLAQQYKFPFAEESAPQSTSSEDLLTLVCICYELDGWLLSDHNILCNLISTNSRQIRRLDHNPGKPDECVYPTSALKRIFRDSPNRHFRYYAKHQHNVEIAREYVKQGRVNVIYQSSRKPLQKSHNFVPHKMAQVSQLDELKNEPSRDLLCEDATPTYERKATRCTRLAAWQII